VIYLGENKDFYSEAKSQMRLSERIVAAIPGYRGYKEKELRRESDKLLRNHLYLKLNTAEKGLKNVFQKLSDKRYFDVLTSMDRVVARMDRLVEKINHANYGYSGFFDIIKVKEENLDRMIDFDNSLVKEVELLSADIDALESDMKNGETKDISKKIENLSDKIEDLEDTFDKRDEVIRGVS